MASNPLQFNRTSVAGRKPTTLADGQPSINIPDRLLFFKDDLGNINPVNLTSDAEKVASGPIASALGAKIGTTGNASGATVIPQATAAGGSLASILAGSTPVTAFAIGAGPSVYQGGLVGNPRETYTCIATQVNSAQPVTREFTAVIALDATHGSAVTDPAKIAAGDADKGAMYLGGYFRNGTINSFGLNASATLAPGNTTFQGHWIAEFDLENQAAHTGDAPGFAGLSGKISRGIDITGTGASNTFRNTAAITIGSQINPIWNRGITFSGTVQEDVGSYSNAARFLRDWGSHGVGIDLSSATYAESAIRLANRHIIDGVRTDGSPAPLLTLNNANLLILGGNGVGGVNAQSPLIAGQGLFLVDSGTSYRVNLAAAGAVPSGGRVLYV